MKYDIDKHDYNDAIYQIDQYAAPLQHRLSPDYDPAQADLWVPMSNATTSGKIFGIITEFMTAIAGILFKDAKYSKPGLFAKVKIGIQAIKMVISIVLSLKKQS